LVRGVFIKLNIPYAQYPTTCLTADVLYPIAWEVVRHLECAGFKVISLTGDKCSINRTSFGMNKSKRGRSKEVIYKVRNPYSHDGRYHLLFIRCATFNKNN